MNVPSTSGAPPFASPNASEQVRSSGVLAASVAGDRESPAQLASLRQLVRLRTIAIAGQTVAVAMALALGVALPVLPIAVVIVALAAANLLAARRVARGTPTTHREVAAHLTLDLVAFTVLLLLSGGTANPFALLYLLHVVLMVLLLPGRLALAGSVAVLASFAVAFFFANPLTLVSGTRLPDGEMAIGLGVSFVLTAAVTAWFVGTLVGTLREHDRMLLDAARRGLADEAVVRIGTLAAGAAHELGTPLTTMAVVVDEMRRESESPTVQRDAATLAEQIRACRQALANLGAAAGHTIGGGRAPIDRFLADVVERFRRLRPGLPLEARWHGAVPAPEIFTDGSLSQAILILLNNAADASPHHVAVEGRWDADWLSVAVSDRGEGVPEEKMEKLGRTFFTTKEPGKGTGLGLVLASSTVARLGGTIGWAKREGGGLEALIRLPLGSLRIAPTTR